MRYNLFALWEGLFTILTLPKDPAAKEVWLKRMRRDLKSWDPSPSTRVCTDHFLRMILERMILLVFATMLILG